MSADRATLRVTWAPAPPALRLAPGEVHVWRARLDPPRERIATLAASLDDEERARAGRMRFPHLRDAAVASAALLREVLARYTGRAPAELRFVRGSHGKPSLALPAGTAPRFNLSHASALALVAVSAESELGVDLEPIDEERVDRPLAERVLTPRELALWRSVPSAERATLFFRVWTRKEACMKATGRGLATDPLELEVLIPGPTGAPLLRAELESDALRLRLRELHVDERHAAALATSAAPGAIRTWDLSLAD